MREFGLDGYWRKYIVKYERTSPEKRKFAVTLNFANEGSIVVDFVQRFGTLFAIKPSDSPATIAENNRSWRPWEFSKMVGLSGCSSEMESQKWTRH